MEDKDLKTWYDKLTKNKPLIIAGPCSAETEEQVLTIAHKLKNTDTSILRAGIWKPRTRPGNFEGVGALGLNWLQKAKEETGLLVGTEVANPNHIKLALKHNIDVLWIGARTTVSPFIVQELAEALEGTDKIVLIKNPINPDLSLWLGAVERFYSKNIKNLGVIHRGFSTYEKTTYRNNPQWQIPIELKSKFPNLPLICDPSHIGGKRNLITDICQTALDLKFDGLMIETHCNPDKAWSDAQQQITPEKLQDILLNLNYRKTTSSDDQYRQNLTALRTKIDLIDQNLIELLGKRMQVSEEIGLLKKERNVMVLQHRRWKEVLDKMLKEGQNHNLSNEFILNIFKAIHQESIDHQESILKA